MNKQDDQIVRFGGKNYVRRSVVLQSNVEVVRDSYLGTALWSSNDYSDCDEDDNPEPFDENYGVDDFHDDAVAEAEKDCAHFLELLYQFDLPDGDDYDNLYEAAKDLQGDSRIGHDLWLTRNGHGAGFWDGDYGDYGDRITQLVHDNFGKYAEVNLYADSGGAVHFE